MEGKGSFVVHVFYYFFFFQEKLFYNWAFGVLFPLQKGDFIKVQGQDPWAERIALGFILQCFVFVIVFN